MSRLKHKTDAKELRRSAESMAHWLVAHPLQGEADTRKLLHELQVYQVELEMQNAELRRAQVETDAMLKKVTVLNERLEKSAQDSTASRDKAESAARTKSVVLAEMCREISIQLKVITEMCHKIRRPDADAEQVKRLDKLEAANQQLLRIVDGASELARTQLVRD